MSTHRSRVLARAVAVVALASGFAAMPQAGSAATSAGELQADVEAIHRTGVSGVLGARKGPEGIELAGAGVADLETQAPLDLNSHFRMASNTKTWVATVVLQLVGEGRLSLDDPVERWLPGVVAGNGNDGSRITVRRLLQHTSGLFDYTHDPQALPLLAFTPEAFFAHRYDEHTAEELVQIAMRHPPVWVPTAGSTRWQYSNTNYVLAGMLIKRITGRSWAQEIEDRIIEPLGLTNTYEPGQVATLRAPFAHVYQQFARRGALIDTTEVNHSWGDAAGSLVTTSEDLTRFWSALLGGRLLRPAELAEMQRTVPAKAWDETWPGAGYGLGILRVPVDCGDRSTVYWAHGGDTFGVATRNGFTGDGQRGIVVAQLSALWDFEPVDAATDVAIRHAVCAA